MVGSWGFGIAPVNEDLAARRMAAVEHVLALIDLESVAAPVETADKLSIVKGLFGRALKQDQWGLVRRVGGAWKSQPCLIHSVQERNWRGPPKCSCRRTVPASVIPATSHDPCAEAVR